MRMLTRLSTTAIAITAAALATTANAATIFGSFSLASFGGSFVGGTALTATGLDFGAALGSTGNGFGTNGTALVGNATGSFAGFSGTMANIADISLGATANPYLANPFISFAGSPIVVNFTNAALTRSSLGTSVTITGIATFTDGIAADMSTGMFSLAASSQNGSASSTNFTFSSNEGVTTGAVPEPATWAMMILGMGVIGFAMRRRNVATRLQFA